MEVKKKVFFQVGHQQKQGLGKGNPSVERGSFPEERRYRKGGDTQRVLGLGLYWEVLLSRIRAPDIPWNIWSREDLLRVEEDQVWEDLNRLE